MQGSFLAQYDIGELGSKPFGMNGVEAVLQRLDRLNQEEARTAATQTLEVVFGLFKNMRVVMDGAWAGIHFLRLPS